jgi:erythromycin esterase-like protein
LIGPITDAQSKALAGRADLSRQTLAKLLSCRPEEVEKVYHEQQTKRLKAKKAAMESALNRERRLRRAVARTGHSLEKDRSRVMRETYGEMLWILDERGNVQTHNAAAGVGITLDEVEAWLKVALTDVDKRLRDRWSTDQRPERKVAGSRPPERAGPPIETRFDQI